ncbi:MAG: hypothetical protein V3T35_04895 [Spirochaetia bacterium]
MNLLIIVCLLVGFLLGENVLGLVDAYTIEHLRPFIVLALGWMGFILGENLELNKIIRIPPVLFALTMGQLLGTFLLTSFAIGFYLAHIAGWDMASVTVFSLLAGCMATTTDPITTLGFLHRTRVGGHRSHLLVQMVIIGDVFTVLLFLGVLSYSITHLAAGAEGQGNLLINAVLHLGFGLILGLILSTIIKIDHDQREVTLMLIAAVTLAGGAEMAMGVSPLISCLFAGAFVMSASRAKQAISDIFHQLEKPIYVGFLILCGALFQPQRMGVLFLPLVIYVIVRAVGKLSGGFAISVSQGMENGTRMLGLGLLGQAGLAVVLAVNIYLEMDVEMGLSLVALTTAGILINQVLGLLGMRVFSQHLDKNSGNRKGEEKP